MAEIAEYKCLKCSYKWSGKPEPVICPACHHIYIKWVNFDELRDSGRINR